jgi:hypothetical protein
MSDSAIGVTDSHIVNRLAEHETDATKLWMYGRPLVEYSREQLMALVVMLVKQQSHDMKSNTKLFESLTEIRGVRPRQNRGILARLFG